MDDESQPLSLFDYERVASARLSQMTADYFASGADDGVTLRRNRDALERLALRYRVLRGVGVPDTSIELFGRRLSMPVLVAPTAFAKLAHGDGELAIARAAADAGVTQVLSTLSSYSLEAVAAAAPAPRWFQVYVFRDRAITESLVRRAEAAGYDALMMTVDAPVLGSREADVRNRFSLPDGVFPENLVTEADRRLRSGGQDSGLAQYFAQHIDPTLTWADLEWLCSLTSLPVLVKGVVRGDDAAQALTCGAAGLVVSNHGGRQLDAAPATIEVLPEVVSAAAGHVPVLLDGGIRRGTDVVKALALGATAVLVGRPVLWGLAVSGEAGVRHVFAILAAELQRAMALCGARTVAEVERDLIQN
jgi:isopentenyl diphosphate isomerase/L-lactate dehydrogenase-like FMN-dependent dehydrogenase